MPKVVRFGLPALAVVLLLVAALTTFGVERYVTGSAIPRVEARTGCRVVVASVSALPGRVSLLGVAVKPAGMGAPLITIPRVIVRYSVLGLLSGDPIDSIVVQEPRVALSRSDPQSLQPLAQLLQHLRRSRSGSGGPASPAARVPDVEVRHGALLIDDVRGLHVHASLGAVIGGSSASLRLRRVRVWGEDADAFRAAEVRVDLALGPHPRISGAQLRGPSVVLRRSGPDRQLELQILAEHALALGTEILGESAASAPAEGSGDAGFRVAVQGGRAEAELEGESFAATDIHGWVVLARSPRSTSLSLRGRVLDGAPWELEGQADLVARSGLGHFQVQDLPLAPLLALLPQLPIDRTEDTRLRANLDFRYEDAAGRLALEGRANVDRVALTSSVIASEPLRDMDVEASGKGAVWIRSRELAVTDARFAVNGIPVLVHGDLARSGGLPRITADLSLPPTPCGKLLRSMPSALVANLGGLTLDGVFGADLHVAVDMARPELTDVRFDVGNECRLISEGAVASVERLRGTFVQHTRSAGEPVEFVTGPGSPSWTPYDEISPYMVGAVLTTEDGGFFSHHGFSSESIRQAIIRDLREGRFVVGGSTISMQLVKNVFLTNEKTVARKLQEAVLTWMLEQSMAKEEILELYLNVIEYGPSLYGIRNASEHFFGASPGELTPVQAVYIATVLPDPVRRYGTFLRGSVSEGQLERIHRILRLMSSRGRLDMPLEEALSQPLAFRGAGTVADGPAIESDAAVQ